MALPLIMSNAAAALRGAVQRWISSLEPDPSTTPLCFCLPDMGCSCIPIIASQRDRGTEHAFRVLIARKRYLRPLRFLPVSLARFF